MALGGALGIAGVPMPAVEIGIAASGLLLGLAVALAWRAPLAVAAVLVGAFAVFHGHAHGTELPEAANPVAYSAGFVLCTGALHLAGIAFGELTRLRRGEWLVRGRGRRRRGRRRGVSRRRGLTRRAGAGAPPTCSTPCSSTACCCRCAPAPAWCPRSRAAP